MKVITTKAGPFSFNGMSVVQVKEGQIFEGKNGQKLIDNGWAEEHLTDEEAEDAAELAAQQEADQIQKTKDAEAAERFQVSLERPGIRRIIFARLELCRVHKDTDNDKITFLLRRFN